MKDTCAKRLRAALDKTGLTQAELSRRTNIPKSAISQYLSGAFEPKQDRLELLARVFGVTEAWLMGFDVPEDMPAPITTEDTAEMSAPEQEVLTVHERAVLTAYRAKPEMQKAVDTLLGVAEEPPAIADDMKDTVALGEAVFGKARTAAK